MQVLSKKDNKKNAVLRLICDPGNKTFKGNNPGLFYTILSWITTLGDIEDKMTSAIYFNGENMTPDQILTITKGANNHEFKRVVMRHQWVRFLNEHIQTSRMSDTEKNNILLWLKNFTIDPAFYRNITCHY
jgi:hypothetical protein